MIPTLKLKSTGLFSLIILFYACSPSTQLTKTWTGPSVNSTTWKPFKKVLVMARLKDETSNRIAEDKLVKQFKPGIAIPSYSYLLPGDTIQSAVDARLQKDGFDGLVLMRLTGVDKSLSVQGGSYGGYYGYRYGGPAVVSEDRSYVVETAIYSLESSKMLWSGTTSTFNPSNLDNMLNGIIHAVKNQLIRQGLIKQ